MPKNLKKILVVEDDRILSKAIDTALKTAGFATVIASDGEEGISKAKKELPDLVLLDLIMPKKPGQEVLKELKADETTDDIPVLVLTVVGDSKTIADCLKAGASGYFVKSDYTLEEIVKKVKEKI